MIEYVIAFIIGLLLAPWSFGFIFFVLWLLFYEFLYSIYYRFSIKQYNYKQRLIIFFISIFAWYVGRLFVLSPYKDIGIDI